MNKKEIENIKKAGKIAKDVKEYSKDLIKKGALLVEIAEKIENKIRELGGKPAFPVNLSINEIAAHYTPTHNDQTKAQGLLKVDFGVHIDGFVADNAYSVDLENDPENKKLIETAELALSSALKVIDKNISLSEIGTVVESIAKENNLQPIANLSGHQIEQYNLHAGLTIPNIKTNQTHKIAPGLYAVEPFITSGIGLVKDGQASTIYSLQKEGTVRDNFAREVLNYIIEEYETLPFCSRWIYNQFSSRGLLALRQIEQAGLLHSYPQLIEKAKAKVAQAEHTVLITEKEKIITTL